MKSIQYILLFLICLLSNFVFAKTNVSDSLKANIFYNNSQYDSSIYYFKIYYNFLLLKNDKVSELGKVKLKLGTAYQLSERFDSAFLNFLMRL